MEIRPNGGMGRGLRIVMYWIVVILVVIVDQTTKAASREIAETSPQTMIPGVLNLVHVENTGAAFSMGQGATFLFIAIAVIFVVCATFFVWNTSSLPSGLVIPIGLVAGGGLGNMIDRIIDGSVTDFIATAFIDFPVFNVADICVTVGVFLCMIGFWRWNPQDEEEDDMQTDGQIHA